MKRHEQVIEPIHHHHDWVYVYVRFDSRTRITSLYFFSFNLNDYECGYMNYFSDKEA